MKLNQSRKIHETIKISKKNQVIKAILEREKITRRMTAHLIPRAISHISFRESLFNLHDGRLSPTLPSASSRSPSITRLRTSSVVTLTEGAKLENLIKRSIYFFYLFLLSRYFHTHSESRYLIV